MSRWNYAFSKKDPAEIWNGVTFAYVGDPGEVFTFTAATVVPTPSSLTVGAVVAAGNTVTTQLAGGVDGTVYTLAITVTDAVLGTWVDRVLLPVGYRQPGDP